MSHFISKQSRLAPLSAALIVLTCLAISACGSSSSSSSTSSTAAAATTTTTTTRAATATTATANQRPASGRFATLRACLQKNGITLPKPTPGKGPKVGSAGQGPPASGFLGAPGSGPTLPKGVTHSQYEAAVKKCGGFGPGRFHAGASSRRIDTPAFRQALDKFASCMRENGINIPSPNTSGKGPIFDTKSLNPTSVKFRSAQVKCVKLLRNAFRAQPGAGGAPPSSAG